MARVTPSKELERLTDERDHLRIQLSLENDKRSPDDTTIASIRLRLRKLEAQIAEENAKMIV